MAAVCPHSAYRSLPACGFRGGVSAFRSQRVQHRRSTAAVRVCRAKRRESSDDDQEPTGIVGKFTRTISSRGLGTRKLSNRKDAEKPDANKQGGLGLGTFRLGGAGGRRTDPNTVFVAGATGRLGCRVVLELLRNKKLKVRAAARNPDEARQLVKTATEYGILPADAARRITVVPVDLEDADSIAPALGNAGKVVQAIGAAETKLLDFGAPSRVDGKAAIKLVEVAKELGVQQYVMVTSLGTGKFGFPAGLLNLFWGVLIFKKKAEAALEKSGIPYVIVRPGGMERPTDTYKRTHNVRLATRDNLFGGQVSRLQVAELIAAAVSYPEAAQNKVLEVVAEEEAEGMSYLDLLTAHPSERGSDQAAAPQADSEKPTKATQKQVASKTKPGATPAAPQQESGTQKKKSKPWLSAFGGSSKGTDAAGPSSSSAPSLEEAADTAQSGIAQTGDIIQKSFFESLEDLEDRNQKVDDALAAARQERAANAKKNADLLAKQKVENEAKAKKQAEEDRRKQAEEDKRKEQQAKKAEQDKAAAAKKKEQEKKPEPKKPEPKKQPEAKKPEPKAEPKKQPEAKKPEPKAEPKKQPAAQKGEAPKSEAANTPEAKEQAKRAAQNAKEAKEWITNWREGKTKGGSKSVQASAGGAQQKAKQATESAKQAAPDLGKQVFGGFKMPWQKNGAKSQQQAPAASSKKEAPKPAAKGSAAPTKPQVGGAETIEARQKEARKWINDWRARSLEGKLPQEAKAKQ